MMKVLLTAEAGRLPIGLLAQGPPQSSGAQSTSTAKHPVTRTRSTHAARGASHSQARPAKSKKARRPAASSPAAPNR
jgi:hypothetical protein